MIISKKVKIIFYLAIFLALTLILFSIKEANFNKVATKKIKINANEFTVEVSKNPEDLRKGLSEREGICEKCGMLFEFPRSARQSFWMKGMRFPLDIIWINGNNIVYIAKDIPSDYQGVITPENEADKVLEIKAGSADSLGIKEGDEVAF